MLIIITFNGAELQALQAITETFVAVVSTFVAVGLGGTQDTSTRRESAILGKRTVAARAHRDSHWLY